MPADRQESCLKNKAQADREEIESHRMKNSRTQRHGGVYNRGEKTNRRGNEKVTVHWESILDRLTYFVNLLYIAPWDTDTIRKRNHHCSLRLAIAKVLHQTLIAYCSAGDAVFSGNAASECICSQILTCNPQSKKSTLLQNSSLTKILGASRARKLLANRLRSEDACNFCIN